MKIIIKVNFISQQRISSVIGGFVKQVFKNNGLTQEIQSQGFSATGTSLHTHTHTHTHTYIYIHTYIHAHTHASMHSQTHIHTHMGPRMNVLVLYT